MPLETPRRTDLDRHATGVALVAVVLAFASGAAAMHFLGSATNEAQPARAALDPMPASDSVGRDRRAGADVGAPVHLASKPGGWPIRELCRTLTEATGRPILLDRVSSGDLATRIDCTADIEMSGSRLFAWVQAALAQKKLALVPVGPRLASGERTWQLVSQCDPIMISSAIALDDDEVLDYADRDGLYVVTTLRIPDGVDTTRMRNALSPLSTQTAGLGRIQDVPGSRSIVVIDFAPVVASMKRAVDAVGAASSPPERIPAFN